MGIRVPFIFAVWFAQGEPKKALPVGDRFELRSGDNVGTWRSLAVNLIAETIRLGDKVRNW
jgi:hypothetical protein